MMFEFHCIDVMLFGFQPQDTIPDVFVWMLCGGKRVAYTRIPAQNIIYSLVEEERGKDSGRMQTVFLRVSMNEEMDERGGVNKRMNKKMRENDFQRHYAAVRTLD